MEEHAIFFILRQILHSSDCYGMAAVLSSEYLACVFYYNERQRGYHQALPTNEALVARYVSLESGERV